jgi:hypothetical protein
VPQAFAELFNRDCVCLAEIQDADTTLRALGAWFGDENDEHPQLALGMKSRRQVSNPGHEHSLGVRSDPFGLDLATPPRPCG